MPKRKMGDVVVLLPGILGSVLARDKKDVWAVNGGAALHAVLSLGKNIKQLQLDDDPIRRRGSRRRRDRAPAHARHASVPGPVEDRRLQQDRDVDRGAI